MRGARLLIVDDEEHIRETMQLALEAAGYQAASAANGAEALEKFGAGSDWDLVLLDQRMTEMEGLEVLQRLRERDPAVRVIMVTAYGTIDLAVEAMKSGAVDFLRKPFTPDVLRGAVKAALEHPREPVGEEALYLPRLLPPDPRAPQPLILFRTLNGYQYWPVPLPAGEEETEALRIQRAFEVKPPSGPIHRCVVELATCIRELVRLETGRDYPPTDELWDLVCKGALSELLWTHAQLPPATLTVYELNRKQLEVVRSVAGLGPRVRR